MHPRIGWEDFVSTLKSQMMSVIIDAKASVLRC